jgi:hypothetical protein
MRRAYPNRNRAPFRFMNRAGDFHHARLIRDWPSAIGIAPDLVIQHSPQLPPKRPDFIFPDRLVGAEQHRGEELRNVSPLRSFTMRASFSGSEYYDRTNACDRHGVALTFAFCRKPPTFTKTDSTRRAEWRLTRRQPTPSKNGFRIEAE